MTLPIPLTRFVGREAELAKAAALLGISRLLTLTGPGGPARRVLPCTWPKTSRRIFPTGMVCRPLTAVGL